MKNIVVLLLMLVGLTAGCGQSNAAVLIIASDGTYVPKATLAAAATAADGAGKTVVVTTPQTLTANLGWPGDRELRFESGGYIVPNAYLLTGIKKARPEYFGVNTVPGTTDMTTATQYAINAAPVVEFSSSTYLINTVTLQNNTVLIGAGIDKTIIKQGATTGASYGSFYAESSSSTTYLQNIRISDMTIDGQVATKSFSQFEHLVSLNGVKDIFIERVKFLGFRGDGLYLGSGHAGSVERHNVNVTIRNSIFDGVNWDNRNGISVIDGDGVLIENNYFTNCSRTTMPGAIDIEPDASVYHVIKGIKISNNTFKNNKGNAGSIGFNFPDVAWTVQPTDILITGNTLDGVNDPGIQLLHQGNATATRSHGIRVVNNAMINTVNGVRIFGINGATLSKNHINGTFYGPNIGYNTNGFKCLNISLDRNRFERIANDNTSGGGGLSIFTVDYLSITNNTFVNCGKSNGTFGYAIDFNTGTSSYVTMSGNRFENPGSVTTAAIQKEAGHMFTTATNKNFNNELISCTSNNFLADESDTRQAFTPVITAETTAGTGTYTTQKGFYTRIGKKVFVEIELAWTAHTGTGAMNVSIPLTSDPSIGTYTPLLISSSGIAVSAGAQMVGYVQNSPSRIRMFTSNAGTLTAQPIAASGTLWISGSYLAQ